MKEKLCLVLLEIYANKLHHGIRLNLQAHPHREQSLHSARAHTHTHTHLTLPFGPTKGQFKQLHTSRVQRSTTSFYTSKQIQQPYQQLSKYGLVIWLSDRFFSLFKCRVMQLTASLQIVLYYHLLSDLTLFPQLNVISRVQN